MEDKCVMNPIASNNDDDDELILRQKTGNIQEHKYESFLKQSDKWNSVYIIFLFYGIITVLPWNFFVTAQGYWMYKFRNLNIQQANEHSRTDLQTYFVSYLSMATAIPTIVFYVINAILSKRVPHQIRLPGSLFGILILFAVTTVLTRIDSDKWQILFFWITMGTIVVLNACVSTFHGALTGLAACFPSKYLQATMNGQSIAGLFAAICGIIALAFNLPDQDTGFIFFSTALVILFLGFISYFILKKQTFYRHSIYQIKELKIESESDNKINSNLLSILKSIYWDAYSGFVTYFTTLAVYPAIAVLVISTNHQNKSAITNQYFIPVACLVIFNAGDFAGRILSGIFRFPKSGSLLLPLIVTIRIILIPLMMLCNVVTSNRHLPVVFNNDVDFVILNLIVGLSSGYLINLAVIYAPGKVEPQQRELAGSIMALFVGVGACSGAVISGLLITLV